MASKKIAVKVRIISEGLLHVWADDFSGVSEIEGVSHLLKRNVLPEAIYIDIRFDVNEVAAEVEAFLLKKSEQALRK